MNDTEADPSKVLTPTARSVDDRATLELDVGVQDLERGVRYSVARRTSNSVQCGPLQWGREEEREFDFDAHVREGVIGDVRAVVPYGVVEDDAVVRLGDARGCLHWPWR
jgi:hypothetical protein